MCRIEAFYVVVHLLTCSLEATHGRKLKSSGDFSMKSFYRKQEIFFENLPLDGKGSRIILSDFDSMPETHLVAWRDHIVDSFSSSPPAQPFRFKTRDGRLPQLTMIQMGKSAETGLKKGQATKKSKKKTSKVKTSQRSRRTKLVASDSEDAGAEKQKTKQGKRHKKDARSQSEDEESMSDGSDTYSDSDGFVNNPPPPREKIPRVASRKASGPIETLARNDVVFEDEQKMKKRKKKVTDSLSRPSRISLPGSVEQKEKKKQRSEVKASAQDRSMEPDTVSLFLQTKEMSEGTLLPEWKKPGFNPKTVSSLFIKLTGLVFINFCFLFTCGYVWLLIADFFPDCRSPDRKISCLNPISTLQCQFPGTAKLTASSVSEHRQVYVEKESYCLPKPFRLLRCDPHLWFCFASK